MSGSTKKDTPWPALRGNPPPRGDPRRAVEMAIRSMVTLALLTGVMSVYLLVQAHRSTNKSVSMYLYLSYAGGPLFVCLIYGWCALGLKARREAAAFTGMLFACLHLLCSVGFVAWQVAKLIREKGFEWMPFGIITAMTLAWVLALGQLIRQCYVALDGVHIDDDGEDDRRPRPKASLVDKMKKPSGSR